MLVVVLGIYVMSSNMIEEIALNMINKMALKCGADSEEPQRWGKKLTLNSEDQEMQLNGGGAAS